MMDEKPQDSIAYMAVSKSFETYIRPLESSIPAAVILSSIGRQ